jgi:hypothetical protein
MVDQKHEHIESHISKCEYGLMYNLNNLAFASLATSKNSTMKTS